MSDEVANVKFSVRIAGIYTLSVKLYNEHIKNSPFIKRFVANKCDPKHCRIQTAGLNTLFVVHGVPLVILIESRDQYDNIIEDISHEDLDNFSSQVLNNDDGSVINFSIETVIVALYFDRLSKRVKFVFEFNSIGCYAMKILFGGFEIRNHMFNVIVINRKWIVF